MKNCGVATVCSNPNTIIFEAYGPTPAFAVPRSLAHKLVLFDRSTSVDLVDNELICHSNDLPGMTLHYVINPIFFSWSSNVYTMDHIVCDSWWTADDFPGHNAWGFYLNWWHDSLFPLPYLRIDSVFSNSFPSVFTLPEQPADFWLPRPLN